MLMRDSTELFDLLVDQPEKGKPEVHREGETTGHANLSAKVEMAKELNGMGLSRKAIGRILHLSEEVVDRHLGLGEETEKESGS